MGTQSKLGSPQGLRDAVSAPGWRCPSRLGPGRPSAEPAALTTALAGTAPGTPGRLSRRWRWPSAGRRAPSPAWRGPAAQPRASLQRARRCSVSGALPAPPHAGPRLHAGALCGAAGAHAHAEAKPGARYWPFCACAEALSRPTRADFIAGVAGV